MAAGDVGVEEVGEPGCAGEIADGPADVVPAGEELAGYFGGDVAGDAGDEDEGAFGDGWGGFGHGGVCEASLGVKMGEG